MNRFLGNSPDQISEGEKKRRLEEISKEKRLAREEKDERFIETVNALTKEEVELDQKYPDLPPEQPIVVKEIKQDCDFCPSSWVGQTVDSKEVYARYRWGYLSVTVANETVFGKQLDEDKRSEDEVKADAQKNWGENQDRVDSMVNTWRMLKEFGGGVISYDGSLSYRQLREATENWFIWPE